MYEILLRDAVSELVGCGAPLCFAQSGAPRQAYESRSLADDSATNIHLRYVFPTRRNEIQFESSFEHAEAGASALLSMGLPGLSLYLADHLMGLASYIIDTPDFAIEVRPARAWRAETAGYLLFRGKHMHI